MMMGRIFAGLFLCALFIVGGDAQSPDPVEIPVWTVEFLKVRPEFLDTKPSTQILSCY